LNRIKSMLQEHEGKRAKLYRDTGGIPHIGVGRNLNNGLRDDEIDLMLDNDIQQCIEECASAFPWFNTLDQTRQDVITMLCFNMGLPRLNQFVKTLALIQEGKFEESAAELLDSRWAAQVGENRSFTLAGMLSSGEYPGGYD